MTADVIWQIATGILIPTVMFIFKYMADLKKDLYDFKVFVSGNYINKEDLGRIENKIDNIQTLMISILKDEKNVKR